MFVALFKSPRSLFWAIHGRNGSPGIPYHRVVAVGNSLLHVGNVMSACTCAPANVYEVPCNTAGFVLELYLQRVSNILQRFKDDMDRPVLFVDDAKSLVIGGAHTNACKASTSTFTYAINRWYE